MELSLQHIHTWQSTRISLIFFKHSPQIWATSKKQILLEQMERRQGQSQCPWPCPPGPAGSGNGADGGWGQLQMECVAAQPQPQSSGGGKRGSVPVPKSCRERGWTQASVPGCPPPLRLSFLVGNWLVMSYCWMIKQLRTQIFSTVFETERRQTSHWASTPGN